MKGKATTYLKNLAFLAFVSFVFLVGTSNSESIRIHNANDLINFSNNVNSGNTYSGTTVYLDSDIEFDSGLSGLFTPIGSAPSYFRGTFDGQGYTISNFILTSSSQNVGLFGYSTGATIKNVVIDKSCIITSTYSSTGTSDDGIVGSILGYCYSSNNPCTIANTVNIGSVSFDRSVQHDIYIGGIAGYLSIPTNNGYSINVINCANYGTVTNTGSAGTSGYIEIGGLVGYCGGASNVNCNVQNSVNHGVLTNQGSAKKIYIGGISGAIEEYGTIENCVNTGGLNNEHVGGSVGEMIGLIQSSNDVALTHCLSTGSNDFYGFLSTSSGSPKVTDSSKSVSLSITIVSELNGYSGNSDGFNKWILNLDEKEVSFNINGGKVFSITSQLILLPDLDGDSEHTFSGWFTDSSCTNKFDSDDVSSSTTLYGGWGYKVTFSVDDETIITKNVTYGQQYGLFPSIAEEEEGYTFKWFTKENGEGEEITAESIVNTAGDHTLYGHYVPNNYTVTFSFVNKTNITKNVTYGYQYGAFPGVTNEKEGHTLKWFTKENGEGGEITAESIVSTAGDHTLYGYYAPNKYTVTFDFDSGVIINETVEYDKEINFPEDAEREGYTFNGWNNSGITNMPGHDITFTANWTETVQISSNSSQIPSEYVEIVFSKKDLSEKEVKEIINKYVDNADYEIKIIKSDDRTTTVIVKFVDVETATNFVENINAGSDLDKGLIIKVGFIPERVFSSSLLTFPLVHLFYVLF